MRARRPSAVPLAFSLAACASAAVAAQAYDHNGGAEPWVQDVGLAMANAFTGGVTSAASAWPRGEDIGRAFVGGMVGGGVVFAGKRLVVEDFDGAGLGIQSIERDVRLPCTEAPDPLGW